MSHSSLEDSLLKNPVSPFILPTSRGSEEKEDELEDLQEDQLGNYDEDELEESHDMMEDGLFGQEEELEEGEEAREGKTRALPKGTSAEQMRIHRLTHYPFRSWCPQCVAERAKSWPHFRQEVDEVGEIQTVCFDYCFLRDHPGGESVPVMVGREKRSKMMLAHVVPFKGSGVDWLVGQLLRDLRKMGVHGKVILKSDQENTILDVLSDVCKQRGKESDSAVTLVESSPKGESQSNGIAERAVQDLEEGVRTHKLDLETKFKMAVGIGYPCIAWLVENVADIINKFKIGHDGRTAYERLKGKTYKGVIHEFGSVILHRIPKKLKEG